MQGPSNGSVLARMAERRLVCEREIPIQQQRIDSLITVSKIRFDSAKFEAQRTIQTQVKTRKEAKRIALMESISSMQGRIEELKELVEDQGEKKNQYAAIISQQLEALTASKEKCSGKKEHQKQIEEAISWYNRVLGFRIECGHGVKFVFCNINRENPQEEYSFTIRHENDIYTLLKCDPPLSDTKKMVNELNKTNGLFKFVRMMREKFQESATRGISQRFSSHDQDPSVISLSAPVSPVSTERSLQTPRKEKGQLEFLESQSKSRKVTKGLSLQSSSCRRSARLRGLN
ncbi:Unknown protein [Striga hermonthica]|uniref:Kinetochore protein SPC25 n=1 Tax=Striga hermonthica TaxID=68872 RepID=A0A9N7N4L3_STRHE|nr:Unknown protein [Striga hermonthica]